MNNKQTQILITGANGLLGQKLVNQCIDNGISFVATSSSLNKNINCPSDQFVKLDITNQKSVNKVLDKYKPTHIVNTAAMTNVDKCESLPAECENVNVNGVKYLFEWSKANNCHLQHISTDFIFDGKKGNYTETDLANPLSIYGSSKLKSEELLINDTYKNWSILRTIVVYGTANNLSRSNIVLWARTELKKGNNINIVDDQFRAPTWADDLAWACLKSINKNKKGIFHICGPETMSIYDFVLRIAKFYKAESNLVNKIKTDTLGQIAPRPPKTGFNLSKAINELGYKPKSIEESLQLLELELNDK